MKKTEKKIVKHEKLQKKKCLLIDIENKNKIENENKN